MREAGPGELGPALQGALAGREAGSRVRGWEEAHSPGPLPPARVKSPASRERPTPPAWGGPHLGVHLPVPPFPAQGYRGDGTKENRTPKFTQVDPCLTEASVSPLCSQPLLLPLSFCLWQLRHEGGPDAELVGFNPSLPGCPSFYSQARASEAPATH